jgi:hypothetical protein
MPPPVIPARTGLRLIDPAAMVLTPQRLGCHRLLAARLLELHVGDSVFEDRA